MNEYERKSLENYRQGAQSGVMQSATPNVVLQLIGWIDDSEAKVARLRGVVAGMRDENRGARMPRFATQKQCREWLEDDDAETRRLCGEQETARAAEEETK